MVQKNESSSQSENSKGYTKLQVEVFLKYNNVPCDTFIKLSNHKFVKIMNKNDLYGKDIIEKYIDKSINFLYIKNCDVNLFNEFIYKSLRALSTVTNKDIVFAIGMEKESVNFLQDILRFFNVDSDTIFYLNKVCNSCIKTISDTKGLKEIVIPFLNRKDFLSDHSLLTAYIAGIIATQMNCTTMFTLMKLSYAAILHDISLHEEDIEGIDLLEINIDNSKNNLNTDFFKAHPADANSITSKVAKLLPDVTSIILNHHERPDGTGFPRGLFAHQLTQICCLFILAHDFSCRIYGKELSEELVTNTLDFYMKYYNRGNFRAPLNALALALNNEVNSSKSA